MPWNCDNLHQPPPVAHYKSQHETCRDLLAMTQSYLKSRLQNAAPDSMLAAAWANFYDIYSGAIRRFVVTRGLRDVDADDCVQEVWMEVAARLPEFEHPETRPGLRAWLYTVVRSKAADFMRRKGREYAQSLDPLWDSPAEPVGNEADPSVRLEREWNVALVRTLLEELRSHVSELNYRVLFMRFIQGRSVSEVAAALQIAPKHVRYRQHRTLRKLQAMLKVYTGKELGA